MKKINLLFIYLLFLATSTSTSTSTSTFADASFCRNKKHMIIGDIHGDLEVLIGMLADKNVIDLKGDWNYSMDQCIVIMGDMIDRGHYSIETYTYLKKLKIQAAKPFSEGRMILLLGNHEVDVLEGRREITIINSGKEWVDKYGHKNFAKTIKNDLKEGLFQASYGINRYGESVLFTHAGLSKESEKAIKKYCPLDNAEDFSSCMNKHFNERFIGKNNNYEVYSSILDGKNGPFQFRGNKGYSKKFIQVKGHEKEAQSFTIKIAEGNVYFVDVSLSTLKDGTSPFNTPQFKRAELAYNYDDEPINKKKFSKNNTRSFILKTSNNNYDKHPSMIKKYRYLVYNPTNVSNPFDKDNYYYYRNRESLKIEEQIIGVILKKLENNLTHLKKDYYKSSQTSFKTIKESLMEYIYDDFSSNDSCFSCSIFNDENSQEARMMDLAGLKLTNEYWFKKIVNPGEASDGLKTAILNKFFIDYSQPFGHYNKSFNVNLIEKYKRYESTIYKLKFRETILENFFNYKSININSPELIESLNEYKKISNDILKFVKLAEHADSKKQKETKKQSNKYNSQIIKKIYRDNKKVIFDLKVKNLEKLAKILGIDIAELIKEYKSYEEKEISKILINDVIYDDEIQEDLRVKMIKLLVESGSIKIDILEGYFSNNDKK